MFKTMFKKTVTAEVIQRELVDKQDALMEEVRAILAEKIETTPIATRLMALGFTNAKGVAEHKAKEQRRTEAAKKAALAESYALKYPGFKFIDEDTLSEVCQKYGLVCGNVSRYKGEVPEWAVAAIERSGLMQTNWGVRAYGSSGWRGDLYLRGSQVEAIRSAVQMNEVGSSIIYYPESECNLQIAAPIAEMVVGEHEEVKGHKIRVKDPIVHIEVEGGVLVICAWGEEGKDPRVFNALNN